MQDFVGGELIDHASDDGLTRQLALFGQQRDGHRLAHAADEHHVAQRGLDGCRVFVRRQLLGAELGLDLGIAPEKLDHLRAEARVPQLVHAHAEHRRLELERGLGFHELR